MMQLSLEKHGPQPVGCSRLDDPETGHHDPDGPLQPDILRLTDTDSCRTVSKLKYGPFLY